jgi:hypothetical protein
MTTVRTASRSQRRMDAPARARPVLPWWALLPPVLTFALLLTLLVNAPAPVPGERPAVMGLFDGARQLLADPP